MGGFGSTPCVGTMNSENYPYYGCEQAGDEKQLYLDYNEFEKESFQRCPSQVRTSLQRSNNSIEKLDSPTMRTPKSPKALHSPIDKSMISGPSNFVHEQHESDPHKLEASSQGLKHSLSAFSEDQNSSLKALISSPSNFHHVSHADTPLEAKAILSPRPDISSPSQFQHVSHADSLQGMEQLFKDTKLTNMLSRKLQHLLSFSTRTARQKALRQELAQLQKEDQKLLRTNYLIRESIVANEKKKKMALDDFEILNVLGHGGFGVVRLVKEKQTGEIFAIKSLAKHMTVERHQSEHVKAERRILSIASEFGDWIVRLFYSFQDATFLHFVMEFMPGGDLLGLLIKKDVFEEGFAKFYAAEIVMAVEEVHKLGMIHRDIKVRHSDIA
jgi:hypothetical protein